MTELKQSRKPEFQYPQRLLDGRLLSIMQLQV